MVLPKLLCVRDVLEHMAPFLRNSMINFEIGKKKIDLRNDEENKIYQKNHDVIYLIIYTIRKRVVSPLS